MRWIKRLVVGTLSVVIVLVALALIVPFLIPTSTYKDQIETRVKAATGRDLKLGGELKLSILPSLELSASDVAFGNRPGAAQTDMVRLKGLNLKLKLAPLLSGRFEIVALELVEPAIVLEIDKDGKPNWQFDKPAGAPAAAPPAPAKPGDSAQAPSRLPSDIFDTLQIETLRVVRGNVAYSDARTGAKYDIAKANLEISLPGGARPFRISGDIDYKGKQVAFKTEVKAPIEMMKGQPSDLAIELSLGDLGKLTLQGSAQADPKNPKAARVSGPLKIDVPSVRALAAWAGAPLAPGKAFGPMNFSATVSLAADRVSLSALAFKLDEIAASGELVLALGPVPTLTGALVIPSLNLTPFMVPPAAAPAPARPGTSPAQPARPGAAPAPGAIDPAPLRAVNADLTIEARQIQANQFRSALAKIGIKLAGGVLAVTLNPVELYGGTATGTVTVNGSRAPLSVNPNIQLKGINGHALLAAVGATDSIDGTLNATANLTGTGSDAKAIQNSLNGTARFQFANGALRGYNLAGMFRAIGDIKNPLEIIQQVKKAVDSLNKFDASQKTDFSELSASFRAANGVFNTSDLRMAAPLIRVEGRGNIALPASALDMHLLVKAVPTLQGQGASFAKLGIPIPLRVHGPFTNVAWALDEKALGDEIRKKAPELIKEQILQKPGDLLKKPGDLIKKPGGILDQFRR